MNTEYSEIYRNNISYTTYFTGLFFVSLILTACNPVIEKRGNQLFGYLVAQKCTDQPDVN